MDASYWGRVKELFHAARSQPEPHRREFIDAKCDDAALADDVASLLSADAGAAAILEPAADEQYPTPNPDALINKQIGGYSLRRVLGCGGMGTVYEAEQEEPRRRVALKIVRTGDLVDQHRLRLFRREVQALALLNHPNVAAFYESGRTNDGHYYFAMELIEGEPVSTFAICRNLAIDGRLRLFIQVCEAVAYAHQRGVIHRDLKPTNILVDSAGRVKVLDFGLAKITDADLALTTITRDSGRVQGTLAYMSPEQARGDSAAIDVRSDIYSLGVVLFELLTGEMPYDVRQGALPQIVRRICDESPKRPSSVQRVLRGDLETILLKALEKEPSRRFQSCPEFANDILRFLDGLPISARPPSAIYQIRKLVTRHKLSAVLVASFILILAGFGGSMSLLYGQSKRNLTRALDAEQMADTRADRAEQLSSFFVDVLGNMDPGQADSFGFQVQNSVWRVSGAVPEALRDLLAGKRDEVLAEQRRDGDTPGVANRLFSLGVLAVARHEHRDAELLTREALRIMRIHPDVYYSQLPLGLHAHGAALEDVGKPLEAMSFYRESLNLESERNGSESSHAIACRLRIAHLLIQQTHEFNEAEKILNDVQTILDHRFGPRNVFHSWRYRLRGELHLRQGRYDRAAEAFQQELDLVKRSGVQLEAAQIASGGLAASWILQERAADARSIIEKSRFPAKALFHAGNYLRAANAREAARALYVEARDRSTDPTDRDQAILSAYSLPVASQGLDLDNETTLREISQRRFARFGQQDQLARDARSKLAWAIYDRDIPAARPLFEEIVLANREWPGSDSSSTADALRALANIYLNYLQQFDKAEIIGAEAWRLGRARFGDKDARTWRAQGFYANAILRQGRLDEAEEIFENRRHLAEELYGTDSPQCLGSRCSLGLVELRRGKPEAAAAIFGDVLATYELRQSRDERAIAITRGRLGESLIALGRYGNAEEHMLASLSVIESRCGPTSLAASDVRSAIIRLFEARGDVHEANLWRDRQSSRTTK